MMKTRSVLSTLMLAVLMATMLVACGSGGDETPDNTSSLTSANLTTDGYYDGLLYYKITSNSPNEVAISKANKNAQTVKIPVSVVIEGNTYKCTNISSGAFSSCKDLVSLTMPDDIISIGDVAFRYCTKLSSVTLPSKLTTISHYAFDGCTSLASIAIPENVTFIEEGAFQDCASLTSVTLSNGVYSIGNYAFNGCENLVTLEIPGSTHFIGDSAFEGCVRLATVSIKGNAACIGIDAFRGCSSLTDFSFSSSYIGENALADCFALKTIRSNRFAPTLFSYAAFNRDDEQEFFYGRYDSQRTTVRNSNSGNLTIGNSKYKTSYVLYDQAEITNPEVYANAILYIRKEMREGYQSAPGWYNFATVVEE